MQMNEKQAEKYANKLKSMHLARMETYEYYYIFKYSSGMKKVIGSHEPSPPMRTAKRLATQNNWGIIVAHHKMPKEAARKYVREQADNLGEVLDPYKYTDINTEEDLKPVITASDDELWNNYSVRIDPEIRKEDIPVEDLVESTTEKHDKELDDDLVLHVSDFRKLLARIIKQHDKLESIVEEFVTSPEEVDDDETQFIVLWAKIVQKNVSKADDILQMIIDNLEGC